MTNAYQLRIIVLYAFALLLALIVGFFVSQPDSSTSMLAIGLVLAIGCLPILMKWHHPILIVTWNAALNAFFLPGQPDFWMAMAVISFCFSLWRRSLDRKSTLFFVPSISWPLLMLALVVLITAQVNGGLGFRALGSSSFGSKKYIAVLAAIMGYFALSYQSISRKRAVFYASIFFLSGATAVISDFAYAAGPSFYFLFLFFPTNLAIMQAGTGFLQSSAFRLEGAAWASVAVFCFMLVRYGIRGIFNVRKPWRLFFLVCCVIACLLGGFRSRLAFLVLLFFTQFFLEGLFRTRLLPVLVGLIIGASVLVVAFIDKMPPPVQRAFSFLPVEVDAAVRRDAEGSTEWRVEMWQVVMQEVPKYFWLGKGYALSPTDMYLTEQAVRLGVARDYDMAIVVGNYHNGILTLLIPLGIFGLLMFLWFLWGGIGALYRNYRYGDASLKTINTFLLSFFVVKVIFFFAIAAAFDFEFFIFTGTLGLSVSLNSGVVNRFKKQVLQPSSTKELVAAK